MNAISAMSNNSATMPPTIPPIRALSVELLLSFDAAAVVFMLDNDDDVTVDVDDDIDM